MENLASLLESIYTTWLNPSSTIWAMDMILAFVCGLGLYLLLLPFLESHLSSPPSTIKFTRKPQIQMTWKSQYKKKFRNYCRNDAKAWGECLKKLKEKEKDKLFLEETSPGHHLNSLGNMFNLPSAKQDSSTLSPFWNLKEKSEEQMTTQKLSYPKISGDHFQQKYDQLFWGLPSLHSESLVAAAWIPQATSALPSPFFLFNVISSVYPIQLQDKTSPMLPHTHSLSYLDLQAPSLILSPLKFQSSAFNQIHFQSPPPVLLPSSIPYNNDFGTSYSQSQSKPQYFPTEIKYRERSSLTKLESRLTLPLMVQNPQEAYDILAPNPSQGLAVCILPDNFPISCELREKLEQHIQKWLIQHKWDFPHKIQESEEVMVPQNAVTENCQTRDKPCTSQALVSTGEHSKEGQKVKFQLEKESGKNLGPILGKVPKNPIRGLEKSIIKTKGANILESESISAKCLKNDSRNDSTNHIDKDLENNLKAYLSTKSGQINQGLTPLGVQQFCLALENSFYKSDIYIETRNLATLTSSKKFMCSQEKLAFLNPETRQALEAHVVRFWVKHRWGLPLKILKLIKLFKLKRTESLTAAPCNQSSSTNSVHETNSAVEVARFLGKPCLRQMKIKDSFPLPENLLVSSPSCKRAMRRLPSGVDHEPSTALPTKPESGHHSETLTYNFIDTPSQRRGVLKKEIESKEVPFMPSGTSAQNSGPYNLQSKVVPCPKHSRSMLLPGNTLNSNVLGDVLMVDGGNDLIQQRPSTPKHQVLQKGRIKMLAPTYQGEDTKRQSERNCEDRCKFISVKEKKVNSGSQNYQTLPKTTQVIPESLFQRLLNRFLQWIHPTETIKRQEYHPQKGNLTAATAQNQRRQVRNKPYTDNNVSEAQELMTAVGQLLEKKMMLQHQLCASKLNQHREVPPTPTSRFPHDQMSVSCLEQRRAPSYPATSSCQRCPTQDRHIRDQLPQKSVHFSMEPQIPRNPSHLSPNSALNLVNSSQKRTTVPGIPNRHLYCPRHCAPQRNVCRLAHSSVVLPNKKT